MNRDFIKLLSHMNDGKINADFNMLSERQLKDGNIRLFVDEEEKMYFFAEYIGNDEENNFSKIEKATIFDEDFYGENGIRPSDSYLILFWEVEKIDQSILSNVLKLEENEMYFKKHVIYYTTTEYTELNDFLLSKGPIKLDSLVKMISENKDIPTNAYSLLIRILTKIPFWRLSFPSAELISCEAKLSELIQKMRTDARDINKLRTYFSDESSDPQMIAQSIFNDYVGEYCKWDI